MLKTLLDILAQERGQRLPATMTQAQMERTFRALCNVRPPGPASAELLRLQDAYLTEATQRRGVVDASMLSFNDGISLWQGDITRLGADAIVNACNARLLGCFQPLHNCIDNVIHTWAGVQVRQDCDREMKGGLLPNGQVVTTSAYNLPSRFIFHTVGPIVNGRAPGAQDAADLTSCYTTSLERAAQMGLESIAFCCISTGVYGYPQQDAAEVAVGAVRDWLRQHNGGPQVIFNVFLDKDRGIYERLLS